MRTNSIALSKPDPLYLVLREPFFRAVVELGGARALVRRHFLRVFKGAAIGKITGDARRTERVIADRRVNAGGGRAPTDHAPGVRLIHGLFG
jgi:hypothetical protein